MTRSPGYHAGPLVIPGVAEITLQWAQANGKNASNVLHATAGSPADITQALCDAILSDIGGDGRWTAYATCLAENTSLFAVKARSLDSALLPQFQSTGVALSGLGTTGTVPEAVALVCTLKTDVAGRTGRGRVYLTGFDPAFVDGAGHATGGLTAAANGFLALVMDVFASNGLLLAVANREHDAYTSPATGLEVPAAAAGYHLVESAIVLDNVFDSQRRRK